VYGKSLDPTACAAAVADALGPDFTCVVRSTAAACAAAVADGAADLVRAGSDDTHAAVKAHGLVPVAAEEYGQGESTAYWAVAVVRASWCEATNGGKPRLADLKGARLCSTGYRKGAGWTTPVGTLLASGAMKSGAAPAGVAGDAAAVASFFGPVCAPRKTSSGPRAVGAGAALWPAGLCDGCLSAEEQARLSPPAGGKKYTFCEEGAASDGGSDAWSGYSGAIDCLLAAPDGSPVVMFNKADAKTSDGTKLADSPAAASLRLLCPVTSTCAPLNDYRNCNLGRVRAHTLLARPAWAASPARGVAVAALTASDAATALAEGASKTAPFHSKDVKSVLDCEADGGRCGSDFPAWFGLTRAYNALDGVKARRGLSPGAIAGIVIGSMVGLALLVLAGVALTRRVRHGREPAVVGNKAFMSSVA